MKEIDKETGAEIEGGRASSANAGSAAHQQAETEPGQRQLFNWMVGEYQSAEQNSEPDPLDFLPLEPLPPGPLERRPRAQDSRASVAFAITFAIISLSAWQWQRDLSVSYHSLQSEGEYWRLATALFAHLDLVHLLSNLPLFIVFGTLLTAHFGAIFMLWSSLLIGLLSNLLTVYLYEPDTRLLGASGMIYGMAALWQALYFRFEKNKKSSEKWMRCLGFTAIVLFPSTIEKNTSYLAHAWGFAIGVAYGVAVGKFVRPRALPAATAK